MDNLDKLKDIKPIVNIPDNSLYELIALTLFLVAILALIAIYLSKRGVRRRKRVILSDKEIAKNELKELDFTNSKDAVYKFDKYIRYFLDQESLTKYKEFLDSLSIYKYKKDVPPLDKSSIEKIKEIIKEVADV